MANVKVSIITIGDELLIGQTIDTNSAWMAQQLNGYGFDVVRRVAVGDSGGEIRYALDEEQKRSEIVLITGGLGPTADDITKPFLCDYFGSKLVVNKEVKDHVLHIFSRRNMPVLERNLRQAEVPDNCEVLFNSNGTAPGMLFRKDDRIIISMPGVPNEMKGIMEDHVIPFLRQNFRRESICHRTIMTAGLGESFIAERIMSLEENLPSHIKLAYLPNNWMVRLRLTGRGDDEIRLIKEVERYAGELAEMLQDIVVAMEDLSLEHLIGKQLATQEKTLGLAESCTGGHIAHKITQVMGSAKYFNGSIVSYQNETKKKLVNVDGQLLEEKGAVSEEVAAAMARGARKNLNADFGLGITGLLSPGGDDGDVPVGTVWMGVCDADTVKTKKIHVPYDRLKNKEIATDMALLLLWKFINKKV